MFVFTTILVNHLQELYCEINVNNRSILAGEGDWGYKCVPNESVKGGPVVDDVHEKFTYWILDTGPPILLDPIDIVQVINFNIVVTSLC